MSTPKISRDFVLALPKTDLHVHLDGSLRISTLIELAKEYNVELPSYTEEGLRELVFKDRYDSLGDYLKGFGYTCAVLQSEVALERSGYELAIDNQNEGVWRPQESHRNFSLYREALHSYTGDDGDHDGDLYYDNCDGEDDDGGDDIHL